MTEKVNKQFKLHMSGLLEVLAGSLYANQDVGLRELIQNAHDSCTRRTIEGKQRFYQPHIYIHTDPQAKTLTIQDNGSGLTEDEIETYLTTIGRSYTRRLRDNLAIFEPDEATDLIGQFGFGFLSAFMLAAEVTLITQSWQPNTPALRWFCDGGENYTIAEAEREDIGTTIFLKLQPQAYYLLEADILRAKVQQFADFLPIPIILNQERAPTNLMHPPWENGHDANAISAYINRIYHHMEPLAIIPIKDHFIDIGDDALEIPMNGFLFIPPASVASVREYGDLRVYIRRMFICEGEEALLPPWARFVRGVIDCPYVQPTASRESIRHDETFFMVQRALHEQLTAALQTIAQDDPVRWRKIVRGHTDIMTGWAVRDDAFFDQVANILTFRTSQGHLTLPQYLQHSNNTLYYVTREINSLQEKVLAEGNQAPVIEAVWFAVKPFLEKYAQRFGPFQLVAMDGDARQLLQAADEAPLIEFVAAYQRQGIRVRVATFAPTAVPALMIYPEDIELHLEAQQAREQEDMPTAIMGLIDAFMDEKTNSDDLAGTLYLNAQSPFWHHLSQQDLPNDKLDAVTQLIYQMARLFSGRALTATTATEAFTTFNHAVMELLSNE